MQVATHLVAGIESLLINQALSKAQCHGSVISPLPGLKAKGPATHHVGDRIKTAGWLELKGSAQGITRSQTEKSPSTTLSQSVVPCLGRD